MASIQPLRAASGCPACRSLALRLFTNTPAFSLATRANTRRPALSQQQTASFSALRQTASFRKSPAIVEYTDGDEANGAKVRESGGSSAASDAEEPWYLRVDPPKHPTLLDTISPPPEAPEGSPQIAHALIQFVADDLGLENLSLLDLRDMDPPPALGPGLTMLFGTARSERHLHVSADRLVRWLRGRGISTAADGLLGRNELKTRLRRKARKAKLLGTSGSLRAADDDLSTGWVCINLGTIGWSEPEAEIVDEEGRASGFGTPRTGTTIVVQMFTEARRAEMDLEAFWTKLARRKRGITEEEPPKEKVAFPSKPRVRPQVTQSTPATPATPATQKTPPSDPFQVLMQRRVFSTASRRPSAPPTGDSLAEKVQAALTDPHAVSEISDLLAHDMGQKVQLLEQMKVYFATLPVPSAVLALRRGELTEEKKSSPFLRLFNLSTVGLPPDQSWGARLWLHTNGRKLGLMEYDLRQTADLVRELRYSGINASREQLADLTRAIFAQPSRSDAVVREQAELAMQVVDTMHGRGQEVISNDVLVAILSSLVRSGAGGSEVDRIRSNLEFLLYQANLPYPDEKLLLELLDAYASQGSWDSFWKAWRIPPKFGVARSPRMYAYLYQRFADTQNQSLCIDAVRWCFQEMVNEDPIVPPRDAVLEALKACVRVADPQAEAIADNLVIKDGDSEKLANREFVKLLRSL